MLHSVSPDDTADTDLQCSFTIFTAFFADTGTDPGEARLDDIGGGGGGAGPGGGGGGAGPRDDLNIGGGGGGGTDFIPGGAGGGGGGGTNDEVAGGGGGGGPEPGDGVVEGRPGPSAASS